ncbi:hypothetical protein COL154_014361, partial [Colletotrichum chrysophilum]
IVLRNGKLVAVTAIARSVRERQSDQGIRHPRREILRSTRDNALLEFGDSLQRTIEHTILECIVIVETLAKTPATEIFQGAFRSGSVFQTGRPPVKDLELADKRAFAEDIDDEFTAVMQNGNHVHNARVNERKLVGPRLKS